MATLATFKPPAVQNEPTLNYARGSPEREKLASAIAAFKKQAPLQIPLVINGEDVTTASEVQTQLNPSAYKTTPVARFQAAGPQEVNLAIDTALAAKKAWEALPFADRAAVFLKAAHLVSTKYRYELMAATMVGQGKNAWQAEIDAAAELCDFLSSRSIMLPGFGSQSSSFLTSVPLSDRITRAKSSFFSLNKQLTSPLPPPSRLEYRPLEGFVYAVSPFNFTAIGGNLPAAPALMGNVVVWKPSPFAVAANYLTYSILVEAGLPRGVIQFVTGDAEQITKTVLDHPHFAALHYTGSTAVFRSLYGKIAQGVADGKYISYPRIVGETGGKNFHLIHRSADIPNAVKNTVRAAFEFQGQKCSACSRAYVPSSIWPEFRGQLVAETKALKIGDPEDFSNFMGPVIHAAAFKKLSSAIDEANKDSRLELLAGGSYSDETGYFIHPTVYATTDATHPILSTEYFGPILAVLVYDDGADGAGGSSAFESICKTIDATSPYALTGAIFAQDRAAVSYAEDALRSAAGNFYINVKCTGAVVGQQPFGGARASGTNDKAGSIGLLNRFVSVRALKEEFEGLQKVKYVSNE
ncbi:hypothetical protein RJZ56_006421 [Blastomyces dermatitidis]